MKNGDNIANIAVEYNNHIGYILIDPIPAAWLKVEWSFMENNKH